MSNRQTSNQSSIEVENFYYKAQANRTLPFLYVFFTKYGIFYTIFVFFVLFYVDLSFFVLMGILGGYVIGYKYFLRENNTQREQMYLYTKINEFLGIEKKDFDDDFGDEDEE